MQYPGRTREVPHAHMIGYIRADGRWTWRMRLWMGGLALGALIWLGELVLVAIRFLAR